MWPTGPALLHRAAPLLLDYAAGVKVDCGPNWTREQIEGAIARGPHPTAKDPTAIDAIRAETTEKAAAGLLRLVPWHDIEKNLPPKLKVSPIAAIPHKSRSYRMILDLSWAISSGKFKAVPVNEATVQLAPQEAMAQLARVLPRLIWALAKAPEELGAFLFAKLDIKDGYWRMVVNPDDAWNFAYVLPRKDASEPIVLVVPQSLQMGWLESPPYFCAATETARDVAERLTQLPPGTLPAHPLEHHMLDEAETEANTHDTHYSKLWRFLEVYIDDFIGAIQARTRAALEHTTRALLHAIHSVFPPAELTGHTADEPVSIKKLLSGEGIWQVRKEVLGWILDGARRSVELPPDKATKWRAECKAVRRLKVVPFKRLEKLQGRLVHAAIGLPAGRSLIGPLSRAMAKAQRSHGHKQLQRCVVPVQSNAELLGALRDFGGLLAELEARPTHAKELVPQPLRFLGYCDASGAGAGGIWTALDGTFSPIVWRVAWPDAIRERLVSWENPKGNISNSDLEAGGTLLQYLVLECITDSLRHQQAAIGCDNTPAVSWTSKGNSSSSMVASRLMRAYTTRQRQQESAPCLTFHIAGQENRMADDASRMFTRPATTTEGPGPHQAMGQKGHVFVPDKEFLTTFISRYPLPQGESWRLFQVSDKLQSRVSSELLTPQLTMAWWTRLGATGGAIGNIGDASRESLVWTPISTTEKTSILGSPSSKYSLDGSGGVITTETARKLVHKRCKSRYAPSARPSNWTTVQTPPTNREPTDSTTSGWRSFLRPTAAPIHRPNPNWQSQ